MRVLTAAVLFFLGIVFRAGDDKSVTDWYVCIGILKFLIITTSMMDPQQKCQMANNRTLFSLDLISGLGTESECLVATLGFLHGIREIQIIRMGGGIVP